MLTILAAYAILAVFFMVVAMVLVVGLAAVVAVLDREWDRGYEPAHSARRARKQRYVGAHRATGQRRAPRDDFGFAWA